MTIAPSSDFWTRSRLIGMGAALAVAAVFIAANAHLVVVSFASQPDCVLSPETEGAASYRAAKHSC